MLGDNCHFDQTNRATPAIVLTDLKGRIILSNNVYSTGVTDSQQVYRPGIWLVTGCRILLTRFWATASASVVLSCHLPSQQALPEVLPPEINIEKEFCIWMGYIDCARPVTPADLDNGNLIRVYVGVIENLKSTASASGGYTIQLQARDRMKWFMDSEVYYNPSSLKRMNYISRSDLILDIAARALGTTREIKAVLVDKTTQNSNGTNRQTRRENTNIEICAGCGKNVIANTEFIIDMTSTTIAGAGSNPDDDAINSAVDKPANIWYTAGAPLVGKTRTDVKELEELPEFRIHTTRRGLTVGQSNEAEVGEIINFIVNAGSPLDIFKVLSFQEVYPTELFQHIDGNFYYAPRSNDVTGLDDPKRFYRTYYYRIAPESTNVNQRLLVLREEVSSIGLKTNFLVAKSAPTADSEPYKDFMIHLQTRPHILKDTDYACKFKRIHDPTIKNRSEAAIVATSAARIYGREVRVAMTRTLGDPSLTPGEIIQVLGSPLLEQGGAARAKDDLEKFKEFDTSWNEALKVYAKLPTIEDEAAQEDILTNTGLELPDKSYAKFAPKTNITVKEQTEALKDLMNSLLCFQRSRIVQNQDDELNDDDAVGFNEAPATIFRIEAVAHKFQLGSKGFTTELQLCQPF